MQFPPLVHPVAALSPDEAERTSRQRAVIGIGDVGQRRIAGARILVIGAGGLGAPVVQYLAGAGAGRIDVVDDDVVERSNLARQLLFSAEDLGAPKAVALARAGRRLDPAGDVRGHVRRVDAASADALLDELDPHLVVDTTDHWPTRFVVADACARRSLPLVWGSVVRADGLVTVLWPGRGGAPAVDDLVDRATARADTVSCAEAGVLGPLCGQVGSMLANEAIKLVCGIGDPLVGRIAVVDAWRGTVREVPLVARDGAEPAASPTPPASTTPHGSSGGAEAPARPDPALAVRRVGIDALEGAAVVDLRDDPHPPLAVAGVREVALHALAAAVADGRADELVPRDRPVVLVCEQGPRARFAARTLAADGYADVAVLDGGVGALARDATVDLAAAAAPPRSAEHTPGAAGHA